MRRNTFRHFKRYKIWSENIYIHSPSLVFSLIFVELLFQFSQSEKRNMFVLRGKVGKFGSFEQVNSVSIFRLIANKSRCASRFFYV